MTPARAVPAASGAACWACGAAASPDALLPAHLRCPGCGLRFATSLTATEAAELYDDAYFESYADHDYAAEEQQRSHESRLRVAFVGRFVPPPARLFEVGAAAGFFLDEARRAGYRASGIEPNARLAADARTRLGLELAAGVIEDAELADAGLDAICAWHVLEHLVAPAGALGRLRAALVPGGHLLLELPNAESALARRRGLAWTHLDLPHHVGHYGPAAVRTLLARAGLEIVLIETFPFADYFRPRVHAQTERWAHAALASARVRSPLGPAPHPSRHELLRAVARRPES